MFDFLSKHLNNGKTNNTLVPPPSIDELTQRLANAVKKQYVDGNISVAELQKVIDLASNGARLRTMLNFL